MSRVEVNMLLLLCFFFLCCRVDASTLHAQYSGSEEKINREMKEKNRRRQRRQKWTNTGHHHFLYYFIEAKQTTINKWKASTGAVVDKNHRKMFRHLSYSDYFENVFFFFISRFRICITTLYAIRYTLYIVHALAYSRLKFKNKNK